MKIIIKVKTRAKKEGVERVDQPMLDLDGEPYSQLKRETDMVTYKVSVKEAPVAGKANDAIVRVLAEYFEVGVGRVRLVVGQTSKQKIFEILF